MIAFAESTRNEPAGPPAVAAAPAAPAPSAAPAAPAPSAAPAAPAPSAAPAAPAPSAAPVPVAATDALGPPTPPATLDEADRLGDEIAVLAAQLHAAVWRLLMLLHAYDQAEMLGVGFRSTAHWLSWRTGIALGAAREKVRVARVLPSLPRLSDGLRRGQLSYSKVRALTRVATRENEGDLLEFALHGTAAHVERLVRAWRRVDRNEELRDEARRHERRCLSLYVDEDGSWVVRGRLDPEVGAVLERALDAARRELYPAEDTRGLTNAAQRRADAAGLVAERALGAGPEGEEGGRPADRFQVVVHVDAEALQEDSMRGGRPALENGPGVPAETSRRLACDASKVVMEHGGPASHPAPAPAVPLGRRASPVLRVGRRTRTVPPALRRALEARDGGCRFHGCDCRFTDAHHIRHWADGGETTLENLVLLCRRHHRAVHEGGFRIALTESGEVHVHRPDGRLLPQAPPAPAFQLKRSAEAIAVDPWTATPQWGGEPLDLDFAILTLRK